MTAKLRTHARTSPGSAKLSFVVTSEMVVTLRFDGLALETLKQFAPQNQLFELSIRAIQSERLAVDQYSRGYLDELVYRVDFESSCGCYAGLGCKSITVVSVEPLGGTS